MKKISPWEDFGANVHVLTLDLITTRVDENIASRFIVFDSVLSDYYIVGCTLR